MTTMNRTFTQADKHRRTKKVALWSLLPAGVVLSTLTFAAPGNERFPISIAEVQSKTAERFAAMDTDQSGSIDLSEFEQAKPLNRQHKPRAGARQGDGRRSGHPGGPRHSHRDGLLMQGPQHAQRSALREATAEEMFAILDGDGDGVISKDEYKSKKPGQSRALAMKRAMFKQLDKDQDRLLTPAEMPDPAERLRKVDANNDGVVTRAEMHSARAMQRSKAGGKADVEAG
ncbi:MAG: EF-hand domain-containing protein [bacterium]